MLAYYRAIINMSDNLQKQTRNKCEFLIDLIQHKDMPPYDLKPAWQLMSS